MVPLLAQRQPVKRRCAVIDKRGVFASSIVTNHRDAPRRLQQRLPCNERTRLRRWPREILIPTWAGQPLWLLPTGVRAPFSPTWPSSLTHVIFVSCSFLCSTRSRQSTLLPLHNSPLSPSAPYPPLSHTWARLRAWLSKEYPELGDTLNWGIPPEDLAQIEMQLGFSLPAPVRESYLVADGQEPESSAGCSEGLFFGLQLLPLEDVLDEWRFWRDVDEDPNTGANSRLRELMQSIPPGYVRREYSLRGWIPLVSDKAGNYLGVDMNPAENGVPGQVIAFGRDFDTKVVLWKGDGPGGWGKWLASFVDDLENGDGFEMGQADNAGSDDSEDDIGYESYFYDGTGRGQGDGGGDAGPASMRLSGEYRGWSTLEALAHRSLRKWHEVGLIPDTTVEEKTKVGEPSSIHLCID